MEYDLVFEGGGAKGMVFVGAMREFEARGHTYKRLLGTSAGAITVALLAAGYDSQEMMKALAEKVDGHSVFNRFLGQPGPFQKAEVLKSATLAFFQGVNLPLIPDFIERRLDQAVVEWLSTDPKLACPYSFMEFGGWYSADHFISWLQERLDSGMHLGKPRKYSAMTMAQFFETTQVDVSMVASDTTGAAMLVLNHRTAPDLPLVWAVRMSMSIPMLWQEVVWRKEWGLYRGRDMMGHVIVDGGLLSNFPIELFVSNDPTVKSVMGLEPGASVLGMLIDESMPVPGFVPAVPNAAAAPLVDINKAPVVMRIANLMNTTLSAHDKMVIEAFEDLVVRMPAQGYGTTEFDMPEPKRDLLVEAGCAAMKAYFDRQAAAAAAGGGISFGLDAAEMAEQDRAQHHADKVALKILK